MSDTNIDLGNPDQENEDATPALTTKITRIVHCARCGTTHDIEVRPFSNVPKNILNNEPICTHFAICPVTNEPILIVVYDKWRESV